MGFVDLNDDLFGNAVWGYQELPLYQALYQSEERAFQELASLQEPLSLRDSARCLQKVMRDGSVELFRKILEHSTSGQCTEQYQFPGETPGWGIQGHGSLLTLAAMMDRPQQAALLLEHGYDVNGSGLEIASYLPQDGNAWNDNVPTCANHCASSGCHVFVFTPNTPNIGINCVTPLAAALLCGSLQTAEVLLRHPGIWAKESSAVCRAAVMVIEGAARPALSKARQKNQQEILRQIFFPNQETLPDRETFLRTVYLQPASFVDMCRTGTLQHQLESGFCTEADARRMLEILSIERWWASGDYDRTRTGKLLLLKKRFPSLCREPWVTGIFLQEIVRRIRAGLSYQTLLTAWKQLCGKERDLTWLANDIWLLTWEKLQRFLQKAGENGSLVMDADALGQTFGVSYRSMQTILKTVRFRYRDGNGVNGLIQHLLAQGDLRLLQQANKQGILETEDPKQLMEYLSNTENTRQDVRAMVLTYARNRSGSQRETADWQDCRRWRCWRPWEHLDEEGAHTVLQQLLQQEMSREDCLRTMFRLYQHLDRGFFAPNLSVDHPVYPQLETNSLVGFACCAKSTQPLKLLMKQLPTEVMKNLQAKWGERFCFRGTPLAFAAALGQTEQVKLLLNSGIHPDEEGKGDVSRFFVRTAAFKETGFPVTPILAAILFGHEETVRVLLEHGAKCDFSVPQHRNILMNGSAETLELAAKLPGVGFDKIPTEELEAMRIMTCQQGERTLFWKNLRQIAID